MSTKNKPLDGLFAQLQDIKDADGKLMNTVLFSKNGNPSAGCWIYWIFCSLLLYSINYSSSSAIRGLSP